MPSLRRDLHEANRHSWNAATRAHDSHKAGQAEYLLGGGSTLFPEELLLVGEVRGQSLLHLSCNAGPDTLSFAARGARVTGVDISDEAIESATRLVADSGLPGEFVRADVYDFLPEAALAGRSWDVVFASYGAIGWMSDLDAWARGLAAVLAPGGRFVLVEFHPYGCSFEETLVRREPYFRDGAPDSGPGVSDYVASSGAALVPWGFHEGTRHFENPHASHYFAWTIGELLGALLAAGLRLDAFHEWPYANGCKLFEAMEERPGRRWVLPAGVPSLPLMYGLRATKVAP
jgi:SAM-dependent methyltransferase